MKEDNGMKKTSLFSYLNKQYTETYIVTGIIFLMCVKIVIIYVSYMLRNSVFPFNALSSMFYLLLQIAFVVGLIIISMRRIREHVFLDALLIYRIFKVFPLVYRTISKTILPLMLVMLFWILSQINQFYGIMYIAMFCSFLLFAINCVGVIDQLGRIKKMTEDISQGKREEISLKPSMYMDTKDIAQQLMNIDTMAAKSVGRKHEGRTS